MNALCVCLTAYVCGLLAASYAEVSPWYLLLLLPLPFLFRRFSLTCSGVFLLAILCFAAGVVRYPLNLKPPASVQSFFHAVAGEVLDLHGNILRVEQRAGGGLSLDIELTSVTGDPQGFLRGARLRLYLRDAAQRPLPGQEVYFRSRLRQTRNFGTPGEFDYVRHLAYRQIWFTAFLPDDRGLALVARSGTDLEDLPGLLRQRGLEFISRLPPPDASLLKALLLGAKREMPREQRRQLAEAGISHLFAISGLHLGLLAFLLFSLLRLGYNRFSSLLLWQPAVRVLWLVVLPSLFFYLVLTGDALATRRAFFVLLIVAFLGLMRRRTDPLQLLASLAFLFLLVEPLALWQPSFLLSFCGAGGILWCYRPMQKRIESFPRLVAMPLRLFAVSLAATLATLPFVVAFFHLFSPAAVLNNILAVPAVAFVALPLGLLGLFLAPVSAGSGLLLLQASAWVLQQVLSLSTAALELPGFAARALYLSRLESLALLLACLALLICFRYRRGLVLLLPSLLLALWSPPVANGPELTLFSVGQGESMLLRAEGRVLLIDGGGLRSDSFDVGERLLAPALGFLGVKKLDVVILSHNHPDHSGGLAYVVQHFPVGEFWSLPSEEGLPADLEKALSRQGVARRLIDNGVWRQPGKLLGSRVWVRSGQRAGGGKNDASICIYQSSEAGGVLLTGDLEAEGVEALLAVPLPGPVALLKAPHHGSAGSRPDLYLDVLQPGTVLVSAGYANGYHLPSKRLLDEAERKQIKVRRTDLEGSLHFRVESKRWIGSRWRNGLFR